MKKKLWISNLIIVVSSLIILIFLVKEIDFSSRSLEIPEFTVPNYSGFFVQFSDDSEVQQTLKSEYGNLSRLKINLDFNGDFSGSVTVKISANGDQSQTLFAQDVEFENQNGARLLDIDFGPLKGNNFWLTLSSKARKGTVEVGYEPQKDTYIYGKAMFRGAKDGDDLVFDSFTTLTGETLRVAGQDFMSNIKNDRGFFVFYSILLGLVAFFAMRFW